MTITWEITDTGIEKYENGEYLTVLKSIEEKINEYGSYIQISEQHEGGRMKYEKFPVGHSDEKKRAKAIKAFSAFCHDLTGFPLGKKLTDADLVNKKYISTIQNITFDNGNVWAKVVSRVRVEAPSMSEDLKDSLIERVVAGDVATTQYGGISVPQVPVTSTSPLNDEVPF